MIVEILLFFILAYLIWLWQTRLPPNYPPTPPIRLPFLGHLPYIWWYATDPIMYLDQLSEIYGKDGIMAFHMGRIKFVALTDFKLIKDTFKKEETNFRAATTSSFEIFRALRGAKKGPEGIINNFGRHWQEQRRFMLTTLRDFGFGKAGMEEIINDELLYLKKYIEEEAAKTSDNSISISNFFNIAILNVLWRIAAGERYDYDDVKLKTLIKLVSDLILSAGIRPNITHIFPFLRKLFPSLNKNFRDNIPRFKAVRVFLEEIVEEHKKNFDEQNIQDYIDAHIAESKKTTDPVSSFHPENATEQLVGSLIDLFLAGSETTSSTLTWGLLFMIRNTEVQSKAREEILRVVGTERVPELKDRLNLPYTDAVIMEIQRMGNIVPRSLNHANYLQGTQIGDYYVPQGHIIQGSLHQVLLSETYWKEAGTFNPERFLDDGKVTRDEKLVPFSIGKRQCPGESLARAEIFLFFSGLIQKFEFLPKDPNNPPNLDFFRGITSVPKPFDVKVKQV